MNVKFPKYENESQEQFIYRICEMKESQGWTWEDVACVLNEALDKDFGESAYRKKYQSFKTFYNAKEQDIINNDEYLNSIEEKKKELDKARYKLQATKIETDRIIRQESRYELFYENIRDAIETLPFPTFEYFEYNDSNKEYVLTIADIQCGANFKLDNNKYSLQECANRFNKLFAMISEYVTVNRISTLKVISLGDLVQGLLRMTDLRLNETSVVESTVFVARCIAMFLNSLSKYCDIKYYHVPTSNHTQNRVLGSKANELVCEDMEYIIGNYISDMLRDNHRVEVNLNNGADYIYVPIYNFNVIALHGHTINNLETAIRDLSSAHGKLFDYVFIGHYHNGKVIPGNERAYHDTELLMSPSFQGTDPYALNKLGKSSKAACKLYKFDSIYGCTGMEKFILN